MKALTEKFVCCAIFSNMLACLQGERLDIAFFAVQFTPHILQAIKQQIILA